MNYTKEEYLEHYKNYFNTQEGCCYPCSNQTVVCAIITHDEKLARRTMKKDPCRIFYNRLEWYIDDEHWIWFKGMTNNCRGYRFYKVIIDKNLDKEEIEQVIALCSFYCCSFEII